VSDVCTAWAKAQDCPSSLAKDVLKTMASWFDVRGEGWASVPVLAFETGRSERQVQRALAQLKHGQCGLLIDTGRTEVYLGRVYPIYRMPIDQGPANTRQALKLRRMEDEARGDADVTPSGAECRGRHPTPDTGVTPRGDTGVTQEGKEILQGKTHRARAQAPAAEGRALDQVQAAWIGKAPERVDPVRAAGEWAAAAAEVGEERLARAALRYLAEAGEVQRGHVREFHLWLKGKRWKAWLGEGAPSLPLALVVPPAVPPEVFEVVAASPHGEGAARSWLGKAEWIEERRALVVGPTAARWLKLNVGQLLRDVGVEIEERAA
jgi:hypothetical protein